MTMRIITLEEHFAFPGFLDRIGQQSFHNKGEQLCDLNERRITEMDAAGIDMQMLSLTSPGTESLTGEEAVKMAINANEILAAAIERHPSRFAGFAALPTAAPDLAAAELERMVCQHGFKGAVINGHIQGRYLDDRFFWPIMERAEALQVPIHLHPAPPPQPVIDAYYTGNFSSEVTSILSTAGWGWHIETAVHILRLILSGVFDRYPKLQIIIGHLGEALPFMLPRINQVLQPNLTKLQRPMASYLRENIHYTFSGFNFTAAFLNLLLEVGSDRIMFSVDYPYGSMEKGQAFLSQLPVSNSEREKIAHGNAELLLRL
ncbi:amidohydrolase family protein [Desulfosporosinus sp. FKB]|uniref:amidohydrolase family protein n=1 Tax=Desulfosporosinus sp. FKB TaxID=1969835 RepID=UPI001A9A3207|nr:amidohydrolase family protein [Desulfosporosinus sp. FKB]